MKSYTYPRTRPTLSIESTGGARLGNCYNASYYKVTSAWRLTHEQLRKLNAAGVLGFGQEFTVKSQCDGKEPVAFVDLVPCVVMEGGKVLDEPPVNPYSRTGELYKPSEYGYFVYECEARCDSGD